MSSDADGSIRPVEVKKDGVVTVRSTLTRT
jgi:hypothetical protein